LCSDGLGAVMTLRWEELGKMGERGCMVCLRKGGICIYYPPSRRVGAGVFGGDGVRIGYEIR
jgi:hypothetical protein